MFRFASLGVSAGFSLVLVTGSFFSVLGVSDVEVLTYD